MATEGIHYFRKTNVVTVSSVSVIDKILSRYLNYGVNQEILHYCNELFENHSVSTKDIFSYLTDPVD